jgi:hypothetical protein
MAEPDSRDVFTPGGQKIQGARSVLPGDTRDDFLRWAHEGAGENPLTWQASARDLLDAATAVKASVLDIGDGLMHSLAAVQAMLLGMALECLFKGMYIKRYRVWEEADKAHAIVKNGQYVGIPGVGDHQLPPMADAAGVTLSQGERAVVGRLTDFVLFAGRYPIPVKVENMKPIKRPGGQTVARGYIARQELETAEALANRLMREVEPWR